MNMRDSRFAAKAASFMNAFRVWRLSIETPRLLQPPATTVTFTLRGSPLDLRLRSCAEIIGSGVLPARSLMGLVTLSQRVFDSSALVDALSSFQKDAVEVQSIFATCRDAWDVHLSSMSALLRTLVSAREFQLLELERKRESLEEIGRIQSDATILDRTAQLGSWIEKSSDALAISAVKLARLVDQMRRALGAWSILHLERATLLQQLEERRTAYTQMVALNNEIRKLEDNGVQQEPLTSVKGIKENILEPFIRRAEAVEETQSVLEALAQEVRATATSLAENAGGIPASEAEMAAARRIQQGRFDLPEVLAEALSDSALHDPQSYSQRSVKERLERIGSLVAHIFDQAIDESVVLRTLRNRWGCDGNELVYEWRDYLSRFPNGSARDEALQVINKLERIAFDRAIGAGSREALWSYLRDFHDGAGVDRARQELAKMPAIPTAADVLARITTPPASGLFLGDLQPAESQVGYGTLRINEGGEVKVAGKKCDRFILPHAAARLVYTLPENVVRFSAVGTRIDAKEAEHSTWNYEIEIDDASVFLSPPLHDQPEGIPIEIEIPAGARRLTILIDNFGDSHYDWSVLAYPFLHLKV